MKKHFLSIIALLSISIFAARGQVWERDYLLNTGIHALNYSYAQSSEQFYDATYGALVSGRSSDTTLGSFLLRMNNQGDSLWSKSHYTGSGNSYHFPYQAVTLTYGGSAVTGGYLDTDMSNEHYVLSNYIEIYTK